MERLADVIGSFGFERSYLLDPDKQNAYLSRGDLYPQGLCLDIKGAYPWATAIILLVYAYVPFKAQTGLPGYYIASNKGYHKANALCKRMKESGYRAERFEPPIKALLAANGLGRQLKNSLIALPGLGTRTVFFAIATDCAKPVKYGAADIKGCGGCKLCALACPFGAIDEGGYNPKLCARAYMESADMPDWVMEKLPGLLGCELCQAVCPQNAHIGTREPTAEEEKAFNLERLAKGDIADAKALAGKNMCTNGRLRAQAAVLSSKA